MTHRADLMTEFPGHTHTLGTTALVRHLVANLLWLTVTLLPLNIDTDLLWVSPQLLVTFLLRDIVTLRDREAGAH